MLEGSLSPSFSLKMGHKWGKKRNLWSLVAYSGYAGEAIITLPGQPFLVYGTQNKAEGAPLIPTHPFLAEPAPINPPPPRILWSGQSPKT
jgi:hypothetical protein